MCIVRQWIKEERGDKERLTGQGQDWYYLPVKQWVTIACRRCVYRVLPEELDECIIHSIYMFLEGSQEHSQC